MKPLSRALFVFLLVASWVAVPSWAFASTGTDRAPRFYRPELPHPRPDAPPQRIVSLAPVVTETLFALGLGSRVVGVTRYCDRPEAAKALPKVGGFVDPQLERILSLRPDLVIAMPSFGQRTVLDRLREKGVPVLVGFGDTIEEIRALLPAVGEATGEEERARMLVAELDGALAELASTTANVSTRPRTVVVFQVSPLVVAGPGTFADEAVALAGGRRALPEDAPAWPTLSLEALLSRRPEVIVAAEGQDAAARLREQFEAVAGSPLKPRVVSADRPILMRPGPHLADDVRVLHSLLHPERSPPRP